MEQQKKMKNEKWRKEGLGFRADFYWKSGGIETLTQTMTLQCHRHPQTLNLFFKNLLTTLYARI